MSWILQAWTYFSLAAFFLGNLYKAGRYAKMPMHVRWELYPVAHEKGKESYGGSYFEESDWWLKPREVSKIGELKTIAEEVLTLRAVHEHNPRLWLSSLSFHYGLYMLFGLGLAVLIGAVAQAFALAPLAFLSGGRVVAVWGGVGLLLATVGCLGLLARRTFSPGLRRASTPADFFHLWLLLAVFAASIGNWIWADRGFEVAGGFAAGLISFKPLPALPSWFVLQTALLGLFLAYLPWSHMTHFFAKYFTWHSVRWDDAPNVDGETYAAQAGRLLARPIHWSAPHIKADGRKTWGDVAQGGEES
jgi:nitrate reductase gamma subunit